MQTNILDIIVLAIVLLSAVRGLVRGLSRELADLLRFVGAILLAYFFYRPAAVLVYEHTRLSNVAASITSFILVLIASFLILTIVHYILSKFMEFAFKGPVEKIGGLLSGLIKGTISAAVLVLLVGFWPHDAFRKAVRQDSMAGRWVTAQYPRIYTNIAERCPILYEFHDSLTNNIPDIVKSPPADSDGKEGPDPEPANQSEPEK